MFKRGTKGFTLIELMIVIAVIALLMLVLVPRIGIIKNKSKEAGMKENMLMLEGVVQSVIDQYPANTTGRDDLEAAIAGDLQKVSVEEQQMRNPFTGAFLTTSTGLEDFDCGAGNPTQTNNVVVYNTAGDYTGPGTGAGGTDAEWDNGLTNMTGVIAFAVYDDTTINKLVVRLIPYGADGKRMESMVKNITQ